MKRSKIFLKGKSLFSKNPKLPFFMALSIICLILFPVLSFFFREGGDIKLSPFKDWEQVIFSTLLQAVLSAVFSMTGGIAGAIGLCYFFGKKNYWTLEILCSLPALLPPLVVIVGWFNVLEWIAHFPFSNWFVIFFHVCIYTGMLSVLITRMFTLKFSCLYSWAYLHNTSSFLLFKTLIRYEFKKEILLLLLLVFSFCFTSFSVPLLVGGDSQNLETVMAEKLKDPSTWEEAFFLFGMESLFIFLLFGLTFFSPASKTHLPSRGSRVKSYFLRPFSHPALLVLPLFPAIGIFLGLLEGIFSPQAWIDFFPFFPVILKAGVSTLFIGLLTGFLTLGLLSAVGFCMEKTFLRKFLIAHFISSTAFLGFSFLLIWGDNIMETLLKTCLGLSILFLPSLFKGAGEAVLSSLKTHCVVASQMGAGPWLKFTHIIWPKCASVFLFLSGISAFWACGDFALSSLIITHPQKPLAILIQDLFSSYRAELAVLLVWLMICMGTLCMLVFWGLAFKMSRENLFYSIKKVF